MNGFFIERQEKLGNLINDFSKLEESQKDHFLELTRKLVGIHCGGTYTGMVFQTKSTPIQNIHSGKGILV